MNDINTTTQIVRLTRDTETRYLSSGKSVTSFSGASSKSYSKDGEKKETVSYFDFIAWGKSGEIISEYCKKGSRICVNGSLQQSRWDDQDGKKRSKIEIVVDNFQFLDGKKADDSQASPEPRKDVQNSFNGHEVDSIENNPFSDDDIPF